MKGIFKNKNDACDFVNSCLEKARNKDSNLADQSDIANAILGMFGMSGANWRHFLNNIASLEHVNYLEVGAHTGSTICSALYGNKNIGKISTLDNWSQFSDENTKNILTQNLGSVALTTGYTEEDIGSKIKIFEGDFNTFEYSQLNPIDVYLFDGPHDEESQYQGIVKAYDSFADTSILLVDDWNWGGPRRGTNKALKELNCDVVYRCELHTYPETFDSKTGVLNRFQNSDWHNGVAVFVITKN